MFYAAVVQCSKTIIAPPRAPSAIKPTATTCFEQLAVDYLLWAFMPLLFLTVMIYALRSGYDDDREL